MKIGYPCINRSVECRVNKTFRLDNYSEENLIEKVTNNLNCLKRILEFNLENKLLFFRITSDLVPFASHPVNTFNWQAHFGDKLYEIGDFIRKNSIRISMHPGQYTLINTPKERVLENSIEELKYHCDVLDCMGLGRTAKIQIHVGGVYGDKKSAKQRFIQNYNKLPEEIKKRLVIENDEKSYSLRDCLDISEDIEIPIIFDSFHHSCLNNGESNPEAIEKAGGTWKEEDGILMTDYSSQEPNTRVGTHARYIDIEHFRKYLEETQDFDFDIMLEIKDKEKSALKAIKEIL